MAVFLVIAGNRASLGTAPELRGLAGRIGNWEPSAQTWTTIHQKLFGIFRPVMRSRPNLTIIGVKIAA
jgi:hypothetical protein